MSVERGGRKFAWSAARNATHLPGIHTVTCNLIALAEACVVGEIAYLVLGRLLSGGPVQQPVTTISAIAVAVIVALSAAFTGSWDYDGFASRLALLPGAVISGAFVSFVIFTAGGSPQSVLLSFVTIFSAVFIAKVFGVLTLYAIRLTGGLKRRMAVLGSERADLTRMVDVLSSRDDIEFVSLGTTPDFAALRTLARENNLDEVVLVGASTCQNQLHSLAGLAVTLVRANLDDDVVGKTGSRAVKSISPWNIPVTIIAQPPLRSWNMVAKRMIDIVGAVTATILVSPFLLLCALAIKFESNGPVFFVQNRMGYRGKPFRMIKFRSMYADMTDDIGSQLTCREGDMRVTRIGKILRRTSLDELPQLFNVLRGDMSIVGPRPHPEGAKAGGVLYDTLIPEFYTRYTMLPGITGWAQINGHRGNTETEEHLFARYRADLEYAARWSPADDVIIMARTFVHLLDPKNAF